MSTLHEHTVVLTLGNEMLGDDGAGVLFGRKVAAQADIPVVEGGSAPENMLGVVAQKSPVVILIADAMDFGGEPGEYRVIPSGRIGGNSLSTHGSTELCVRFLEALTEAEVIVLGFQPEQLTFGDGVSPKVARTVERAAGQFVSQGIEGLSPASDGEVES